VSNCVVWSVKGGVGASVVAAGTALAAARSCESLLVDLCGDQPALLGADVDRTIGVAEWCRTVDPRDDALERLEHRVAPHVSLLPAGADPLAAVESWPLVAGSLAEDDRPVVVDAGLVPGGPEPVRGWSSVLVTRACYLGLRRLVGVANPPDRVVLVVEPGRALDRRDVERVVGAPVVASLDLDAAIARRVDAGLLVRRAPSALLAAGRRLW
jgi:hypothetical protein